MEIKTNHIYLTIELPYQASYSMFSTRVADKETQISKIKVIDITETCYVLSHLGETRTFYIMKNDSSVSFIEDLGIEINNK